MVERKRVTPKKASSRKRTSHDAYSSPRRRRTQRFVAILLVVGLVGSLVAGGALLLLFGDDQAADSDTTTTTTEPVEPCPTVDMPAVREPPAPRQPSTAIVDPAKTYVATIDTSCGTMVFELVPATALADVVNFVALANEGFYNDTIFHRIVEDFVIQAGDPTGPDPERAGTGGPGYAYQGTTPEATEGRSVYKIGDLAMANSSDPSSNGSQFFVVSGPNGTQLPPNFSLFGDMQEGFDVLNRIQTTPTRATDTNEGYPEIPVVIKSVTVVESAGNEPAPT